MLQAEWYLGHSWPLWCLGRGHAPPPLCAFKKTSIPCIYIFWNQKLFKFHSTELTSAEVYLYNAFFFQLISRLCHRLHVMRRILLHWDLLQSSATLGVTQWPAEADITELPQRPLQVISVRRSRVQHFAHPLATESNVHFITGKPIIWIVRAVIQTIQVQNQMSSGRGFFVCHRWRLGTAWNARPPRV